MRIDILQITHLVRHFPSREQSRLLRQLQGGVLVSADESRLLSDDASHTGHTGGT